MPGLDYKDYYSILGVAKDSSQDDIQKAYRKLARKFHPDVNKDPQAETQFKEMGEAYEVLKDPDKRAKYDQFGSAWNRAQQTGGGSHPGFEGFDFNDFAGGGGGGAGNFSSFFDMLFGSGAGRRGGAPGFGGFGGAGGPQRGADSEATLTISLEEAVRGGNKEISLSDPSSGGRRNLSVRIPEGIRPGQKIRLAGQGSPGYGGANGDLILKVELHPDARFRVDGSDLKTFVPVLPWEAALGAEAEVETPTGRIRIRIPALSSSGKKIRLRGKGLGVAGGGKGDLLAEIRIVLPERLSDEEIALFAKLAEIAGATADATNGADSAEE
jgi:curved DNA-binding protein